jgi:hypothetical protein
MEKSHYLKLNQITDAHLNGSPCLVGIVLVEWGCPSELCSSGDPYLHLRSAVNTNSILIWTMRWHLVCMNV